MIKVYEHIAKRKFLPFVSVNTLGASVFIATVYNYTPSLTESWLSMSMIGLITSANALNCMNAWKDYQRVAEHIYLNEDAIEVHIPGKVLKFDIGELSMGEENEVPNDFKALRLVTGKTDHFYISYYGTIVDAEKFNNIMNTNLT